MAIRSTLKSILGRVAQRVGKDGLFEQPGERPRTSPIAKAPPNSSQSAPSAAGPARPTAGCRPVGEAELKALLVPGDKPVVINHWATWCEPCVDELPRLVRAHAGIGDKAEVMGISWDLFDNQPGNVPAAELAASVSSKVAEFADSYGVGYGSVLYTGKPETLFALCGLEVHQVPQTLVLARRGGEVKVLWHHKGILLDEDVFPLIRAATQAGG